MKSKRFGDKKISQITSQIEKNTYVKLTATFKAIFNL